MAFVQKLLSCAIYFLRTVHHNNGILEVGKDLWRSSGPTPPLKQGHLDPLAL